MAKFRKKPIVIEAEQYRPGLEDGLGDRFANNTDPGWGYKHDPYIMTLEGPMWISKDDWIITGINGERYPCKDAIFRATYEPVEQEGGEQ